MVLIAALASLLALASRSAAFAPDFLTEVVLYALSATNLTILVALVFVLARNIVKLLVEKRRALPFAHFRAKLVALMLGHDADSRGARPDRRQRRHPQQHRPLVQRADGRRAVVGECDCRRLLPGAAAPGGGPGRAAGSCARRHRPCPRRQPRPSATSSSPTCCRNASASSRCFASRAAGAADRRSSFRSSTSVPAPLPRTSGQAASDSLVARVARGQASAPVVERLPDGGDLIRSAVAVRVAGRKAGRRASSSRATTSPPSSRRARGA